MNSFRPLLHCDVYGPLTKLFQHLHPVEILQSLPFVCKDFERIVEWMLEKRLIPNFTKRTLKQLGIWTKKKKWYNEGKKTGYYKKMGVKSSERVFLKFIEAGYIELKKAQNVCNTHVDYAIIRAGKRNQFLYYDELFKIVEHNNFLKFLKVMIEKYEFLPPLKGHFLPNCEKRDRYEIMKYLYRRLRGFKLSWSTFSYFMGKKDWQTIEILLKEPSNLNRERFYSEFVKKTKEIENVIERFARMDSIFKFKIENCRLFVKNSPSMDWEFLKYVLTRSNEKCKNQGNLITQLAGIDEFVDFAISNPSTNSVLSYYQPRFVLIRICRNNFKDEDFDEQLTKVLSKYEMKEDLHKNTMQFDVENVVSYAKLETLELLLRKIKNIHYSWYCKFLKAKNFGCAELVESVCFAKSNDKGKYEMIQSCLGDRITFENALLLLRTCGRNMEKSHLVQELIKDVVFKSDKLKKFVEKIVEIQNGYISSDNVRYVLSDVKDDDLGSLLFKLQGKESYFSYGYLESCIKNDLPKSAKSLLQPYENNLRELAYHFTVILRDAKDLKGKMNFLTQKVRVKSIPFQCQGGGCNNKFNILDRKTFVVVERKVTSNSFQKYCVVQHDKLMDMRKKRIWCLTCSNKTRDYD